MRHRMPAQDRKVKFAVGTTEAIWASAWFIATVQKGDVYIGSVGPTYVLKLSFHTTGKSHLKYGPGLELGALANSYFRKWQRPPTPMIGLKHVWSVFFPSYFLKARWPRSDNDAILVIPPAADSEAVEVGLFYSREPRVSKLEGMGRVLLSRCFSNGEAVYAIARTVPFDPSKCSEFAKLAAGSLTLPPATWMSAEFSPGHSLDSVGIILFNDPEKDGLAQAVEATSLRLEYNPRRPGA
jgi:hypothetical protein